ncbi:LuxR family transcriptional regulator [Acrocarpospora macrocephala]
MAELLQAGPGVLITGPAGIGKTRLAAEAAANYGEVIRTVATEASREIPLAAFAHLLPASGAAGNPIRWGADLIARPGLVILADDAHHLDPVSATMLEHLVRHRGAKTIATARTGHHVLDSLRKDDLLARIHLDPLSEDGTARLLHGALGSPATDRTIRHLHRLSGGNALFLRELVTAAQDAGILADRGSGWDLSGPVHLSPRLTELIAAKLSRLDETERQVLDYVSLAEPIGLDLLRQLVPAVALESAEARRLIVCEPDGHRRQIRLAHPLYGEVIRNTCPTLRRSRRQRELALALASTGARRSDDTLRVAVWWLDSGFPGDPSMFLRASRYALATLDTPLATRLGWAAFRADGGVETGAWLTQLLNLAGEHEQAATVLRGIPAPADEASLTTLTEARLQAYGLGLRQLDQVKRIYAEAIGRLRTPTHRARIEAVYAYQLAVLLDCRPAAHLPEPVNDPVLAAYTAHAKTTGLVHLGRYRQAADLAGRVLGMADGWRNARPMALLGLELDRHTATLLGGDPATAEHTVVVDHEQALTERLWPAWIGLRLMCRARSARYAGRVREASRQAREAFELTPFAHRGIVLGEVALAAAYGGDADTAAEAVQAVADAKHPTGYRILTFWAELARPWIAALTSDSPTVVKTGIAVADLARAHDLPAFELIALHDLVRLGAAETVHDRLIRAASAHEGDLAPLLADHARAAGDGPALLAAARRYERLGMILYAAETAAQASAVFHRPGPRPEAIFAGAWAFALAARCPGANTPALADLRDPGLTSRETEIAMLAVTNMTSKEIAEHLVISVRTVNNHLQSVYGKLGINGRDALGALLP